MVLVAVIIAVLSASGAFVWRQIQGDIQARRDHLQATAQVLAAAVGSYVAKGDKQATRSALSAIGKIPSVPHVSIVLPGNKLFTSLGTAIVLKSGTESKFSILQSASLPVRIPIINAGQKVGTLVLLVDLSEFRTRLIEGLLGVFVAAFFASIIGLLVARRLRRGITEPLKSLTGAMMRVRQDHDFSARVQKQSDDETGMLVDSFNEMLEQISLRESQLAAHRQNLERTVEERTHELREAKNVAEAANSAKSEFLATMSHEIRTPMNGVMVMAELLAGAGLPKRQQRFAEVIARSGQSLLTIINDILDLSKIESGKLELESLPVDPSSIVDDVMSLFWERAAGKKLDMGAFIAPDVPKTIAADPVRLNQVLTNLVNNALKFTDCGCVSITINMQTDQYDGHSVPFINFIVSDTGVGIAANKLEHVFESFSQADQTTTRRFGGTGLGLSICKRLVEAMSGSIVVKSELEMGSSFSFKIPANILESAPPLLSTVDPVINNVAVIVGGIATPKAISSYLMMFGLDTEVFEPGEVDGLSLEHCDAIFADAIAVRALDRSKYDVPLILVSELGNVSSEELLRDGDAQDQIMRPVSKTDIFDVIERLMTNTLRGVDALANSRTAEDDLPDFGGARILVADDNAINREVIIETLRRLNINVDTAEDGQAAIQKWQEDDHALIFMDCSMPVMDGYEATEFIRTHEHQNAMKPTPIVALTAHVAGGQADRWQQVGMNDMITKPFTLNTIAKCLATWLPVTTSDAVLPASHAGGEKSAERYRAKSSAEIIDLNVIASVREMSGGNNDLLFKTNELFREHAPKALTNLDDLKDGENLKALADAAHALKSMCANMGAARAAAVCDQFEKRARTGADVDVASHIAAIHTELSLAIEELDSICKAS